MGKIDSYREQLQTDAQKSQESYDKAVLTLSGGALALTFTFIKDLIVPGHIRHIYFLLTSWIMWSISILVILFSFLCSYYAIGYAISQIDKGETNYNKLTNWLNKSTILLNIIGGLLFVLATFSFTYFAYTNVKEFSMADKDTRTTVIQSDTQRGLPVRKPPVAPPEKPKEEK